MNKARILALAEVIEKQPHVHPDDAEGFSMSDWFHPCGTPSCLGGWTIHLFVKKGHTTADPTQFRARGLLGLSQTEALDLFLPRLEQIRESYDKITPAHAAFTLRHLAATGEVDWGAYERRKL
jgi:hypothetical protein